MTPQKAEAEQLEMAWREVAKLREELQQARSIIKEASDRICGEVFGMRRDVHLILAKAGKLGVRE